MACRTTLHRFKPWPCYLLLLEVQATYQCPMLQLPLCEIKIIIHRGQRFFPAVNILLEYPMSTLECLIQVLDPPASITTSHKQYLLSDATSNGLRNWVPVTQTHTHTRDPLKIIITIDVFISLVLSFNYLLKFNY